MKYILEKTDTIRELLWIYFIILVMSAMAFSYLESTNLFDAFWWSVVTSMTVGYGDMYPHTVGGKVVGMLLMWFSVLFVLPLLISKVAVLFIKNENEFTHAEQEELKGLLREIRDK